MIPSLSQETITEYASEAQTIQEPAGTDYTQGVRVGKTVPAKWWNWLFRGATKRLGQAKTDAQNMLTELQNTVTDAGMTLDGSDSTQLAQAVRSEADKQIDNFINIKKISFTSTWYTLRAFLNGVECTGNYRREYNYAFNIEDKIVLFTEQFYIGGTNRGRAYTFDLIHWFTASSNVSGTAVITGGYWYSLKGNTGYTALYKNSLDNLGTTGTLILHKETAGANGYTPFITCINGTVYVFTQEGKIYRINADDTYTELAVVAGAGQVQVATNTIVMSIEPVIINDRIFVGNLEFSGGTFVPVFNATNASEIAGYVKVKKLHNGNILFCCASTPISTYELKVLDLQGVVHNIEGSFSDSVIRMNASANDLAVRNYNGQYQLSYDGINFVSLIASVRYITGVLQLRNRYFITAYLYTGEALYYTDDINEDITRLMGGNDPLIYSAYVKDDCIVYRTTISGDTSDYLVSYNLDIEPFSTKVVSLDGTVTDTHYMPPSIVAGIEAFVSRVSTSLSGDFVSYKQLNCVVGHTLYLR